MGTFKTIMLYCVFAFVVNVFGYCYLFSGGDQDAEVKTVRSIELPEAESLYDPERVVISDKTVQCLAKNIYHEARNQSRKGQLAVAFVTMNRVNHVEYPNTVCSVVHQSWQFSWTHSNKKVSTHNKIEKEAWEQSLQIALDVLNGREYNNMYGVTHYHADYVNPEWVQVGLLHSQIGQHIFYTEIL